jgi:hypothetical protein
MEDPANYIDAAFAGWTEHDGATYTDIAVHAMEPERGDRRESAGDATTG